MILANDECPLCERCLKRLTKAEDLLKPRFVNGERGFIIALFCEKCRKIFDERSEKENNDYKKLW